jgi:hypothetical protein
MTYGVWAIDVDDQKITLLHIVKSLGEYLTSEDGKIREKGGSFPFASQLIPMSL